ncbi:antitoxin VapB family protein [Candidatus Woesearchaeota archaeon]|nr:antitoxin VapB family protein [Candidatus Woesearchaeota archaeon]
MARNIMVSNRVYEELKKAKGTDKSFSEVIAEAIENQKPQEKTFGNLMKFAGILKDYHEDEEAIKWLKKAKKMTDDRLWGKSR